MTVILLTIQKPTNPSLVKHLLLATALMTAAFTSCRKEDNNVATGSKANYWRVGNKVCLVDGARTIIPSEYHRMLSAGETSGKTASNISFYFPELPTQSGYYRVTRGVVKGVAADEMSVMTTTYLNGNYEFHHSTGSEKMRAYVTVAGGRISVSMPPVWVLNVNGADSFQVSASVTQTE